MSVRDLLFSFLYIPHPEQIKITLTRCPHAPKLTPILPSPILPVCIPRAVSSGSASFATAVKVALVERLSEADCLEAASRAAYLTSKGTLG
jgi:hypothetical protein